MADNKKRNPKKTGKPRKKPLRKTPLKKTKPKNTRLEDWVDGEQVMTKLKFCKRSMQYYRDNKLLPYSKLGKRYFYYLPAILAILEDNFLN